MGLDIFFGDDIRNALLAANEASAATAARVADLRLDADVVENLRAYREGYKAALFTVALALGLVPAAVVTGWPVAPVSVVAVRKE